MNRDEGFLKKYSEIVTSETTPIARFGHTANLISKNTVVIFGGATSGNGTFTMTTDLYIYNILTNIWKKLERIIFLTNNSYE
jgi:protein phosphatase